jgi:triacylglycerol lipase
VAERKLLQRLLLEEYPQPDLLKTKYPIFLCHGYGAIGALVKPSPMHDPCMLIREHGVVAIAPNVVPYATIETRAKNWVRLIRDVCEKYSFEKVNVVAHSMGGLDMRFALSKLDIDDKVASLTTIATPHRGSYLADLVLKTPEIVTERISEIVDWFGDNVYPSEKSDAIGSVEQLTCNYIQNVFNQQIADAITVPIFSYGAAVGRGTNYALNPIFKFQNSQIFEKEGENDSFVSVKSAQWGEYLGCINISHLNQINVQVGKETRPKYYAFWTGVVKKLFELGF